MNKIIYAILTALAFTSCSQSYKIQGTSNISNLDGRMLYLKAMQNGELKNLDSCEVVHGQFKFSGSTDSSSIATIFMDDESVMPLVLEEGTITIQLNNTKQNCTGTELNDKLFAFLDKYNKLQSQYGDLYHQESQAIMNGDDIDVVHQKLNEEATRILEEEDKLLTGFICENFDNVLGPGVFLMITSSYEYPILNSWIEYILTKATDTFKNHPYVKDYVEAAQRNQNLMNGMEEPTYVPQPQAPLAPVNGDAAAPTPAEMAKPSEM